MSNQTQVKKLKKRTEDYGQTTYVTPTYAPPIYPVYNPYKPPAHFTSQLESSDPAQQTVQFASPVQSPVQFASPTQTPVQFPSPVQLASPVQPTVIFNTPVQTPIRFPSPVQTPVQ